VAHVDPFGAGALEVSRQRSAHRGSEVVSGADLQDGAINERHGESLRGKRKRPAEGRLGTVGGCWSGGPVADLELVARLPAEPQTRQIGELDGSSRGGPVGDRARVADADQAVQAGVQLRVDLLLTPGREQRGADRSEERRAGKGSRPA